MLPSSGCIPARPTSPPLLSNLSSFLISVPSGESRGKTLVAKAGGVCVRSGVVGVGVGLVSGVGRSSNAVSSGRFFDEKTRNYGVFSNFRSSGNAVVRKKGRNYNVFSTIRSPGHGTHAPSGVIRRGFGDLRYQAAQSEGSVGGLGLGNHCIASVCGGGGVQGRARAVSTVEDCSCVGQARYRWWRHRSCCDENGWLQHGIRDADARLRRARVELTWWSLRGEIEEAAGKRRLETAALLALRRAEAKRQRLVRRAAAVEAARLSDESVRAARSAVGCAEVCALRAFVREQARRGSCLPESRYVFSGVEVSLREREGRRGKDSARQASLNSFYAARALHGRCPWAGGVTGGAWRSPSSPLCR